MAPEVPEQLEDLWDEAQEQARDLCLTRLLAGESAENHVNIEKPKRQ